MLKGLMVTGVLMAIAMNDGTMVDGMPMIKPVKPAVIMETMDFAVPEKIQDIKYFKVKTKSESEVNKGRKVYWETIGSENKIPFGKHLYK